MLPISDTTSCMMVLLPVQTCEDAPGQGNTNLGVARQLSIFKPD